MQHKLTLVGDNGKHRVNADDADARYEAALLLVRRIDADLQRGTRYYRDKSGRLLLTLGEVMDAILTDNLQVDAPRRVESARKVSAIVAA